MGLSIRPPLVSRPKTHEGNAASSPAPASGGDAPGRKRANGGHAFSHLEQGRGALPGANTPASNAAPKQDVSKLKNLLAKFGPSKTEKPAGTNIELDPARQNSGRATIKSDDDFGFADAKTVFNKDLGELRAMEGKSIAGQAQSERAQKMQNQGIELDPARHNTGHQVITSDDDESFASSKSILNRSSGELRALEGNAIAGQAQSERTEKMQNQGIELDPARHNIGHQVITSDDDERFANSKTILNNSLAKQHADEGKAIAGQAQSERAEKMQNQGIELDPARHDSGHQVITSDDDKGFANSKTILNNNLSKLRALEGNAIAGQAQSERAEKMQNQGIELDPARHAAP